MLNLSAASEGLASEVDTKKRLITILRRNWMAIYEHHIMTKAFLYYHFIMLSLALVILYLKACEKGDRGSFYSYY